MATRIADRIKDLSHLDSGEIKVEFRDGNQALLDPVSHRGSVWAGVLKKLYEIGLPVYVETEHGTINKLLIPRVVTITRIDALPEGGLRVYWRPSHAIHLLKPSLPEYEQFTSLLNAARRERTQLLITETDTTQEIIDVRVSPNPSSPALAVKASAPEFHLAALRGVNLSDANDLFDLVSSLSCNPQTPTSPCIPFLYPDDGCYSRAHEMCKLIIGSGEQPAKIWIYSGSVLQVKTPNHPDCMVFWDWHVAPIVRINSGGPTNLRVLDPSLFNGPVKKAEWKALQLGASGPLVLTDASIYERDVDGITTTDSTYSKTSIDLEVWRLDLQLRSADYGPPPYKKCH